MTDTPYRVENPAPLGRKVYIMNLGYIQLLDVMGSDSTICNDARMSYLGQRPISDDQTLINTLMRESHTSPFEMGEMKWLVHCPVFVARQWVRHRTASLNEVSGRYVELPPEFYIPDPVEVMGQGTSGNNQVGDGVLPASTRRDFVDHTERSATRQRAVYEEALRRGVSREMARINLPLTQKTTFVWKNDLHNIMKFLKSRCSPSAQPQIREYAQIMMGDFSAMFPKTSVAFDEYVVHAHNFSATELQMLVETLDNDAKTKLTEAAETRITSKRQRRQFMAALDIPVIRPEKT